MTRGVTNHRYFKNGNSKTVCASNVLAALGVDQSKYRYSCGGGMKESVNKMAAILRRHGYAVRSRDSKYKNLSVGQLRPKLKASGEAGFYMVYVSGHVLLLNAQGETVRDTDPRSRDRRQVLHVRRVFEDNSFGM